MKKDIVEITHSQFSIHTVDAMFDRPIFKTTDFITRSKIPKQSAMRILDILKKHKVLVSLRAGKGRQASILMFRKLIDIVEK